MARNSKVSIEGLTFIQANALLMMAENGTLTGAINSFLDKVDTNSKFERAGEPEVEEQCFEEVAEHIINFDN